MSKRLLRDFCTFVAPCLNSLEQRTLELESFVTPTLEMSKLIAVTIELMQTVSQKGSKHGVSKTVNRQQSTAPVFQPLILAWPFGGHVET